MNISINDIENCDNLSSKNIKIIGKKLQISQPNCLKIKKKFNEILPCNIPVFHDTDLTIKKHQLSVANHLVNYRGVVVVHSVGTGKTLCSIATAQCLLSKKIVKKVIVITPTSLQDNFKKQLLQYSENKEYDDFYHYYTLQGIIYSIENKTVESCKDSLVIIDEAHNIRKLDGTRTNILFKYLEKSKKVVLLTATPIINYNYDIINLIAIIKNEKPITIKEFDTIFESKTKIKNYISNMFSFYIRNSGIDNPNFPKKVITEIFLKMTPNYLDKYDKIQEGQAAKIPEFRNKNIKVFYNGVRRASNIIDKMSPKVTWIIKKIKSNIKDKHVVFSHFKSMGINPIINKLKTLHVKYAIITGDMSIKERSAAVESYNSGETTVLFITKAGSEGLDLKNTTNIIIMESTWNENSIEQIIGRGVRYKSHITLPLKKQVVNIYKLMAIKPIEYENIKKILNNHLLELKENELLSVDLYLHNYSWLKQQEIDKFMKKIMKYNIT